MPTEEPAPPTLRHTRTEDGPCRRRLEIHLPADQVEAEAGAAARRLAREVRLPGFRRGKVPPAVIRKRYAQDIQEEVLERLASRHVGTLLQEHGDEPVAPPVLEKHEHQEDGGLLLVAAYDVEAPFQLGEYRGLEATRPAVQVEDKDVDEVLESIRRSLARIRTVEDRGAEPGDEVTLDLAGEHLAGPEQGERFANQGLTLQVGTEDVHPDLAAALPGCKAGDKREATVTYPEAYRTPALAGRTIRYTLGIQAVRERRLPPADDDLAREAGAFQSLEELRGQIRDDLRTEKTRQAEEAVRQGILRQLLERNSFPVPEMLVDREVRRRLEGFARELAARGIDPAQAGIDWKKEGERQAGRATADLRAGRILDAVADKEGIEADGEALSRVLEAEAGREGKPVAALRAQWEREGRLSALKSHLRRDRVLDFLVSVGHIHNEGEQP